MAQVATSVSELARSPELRACLDWFRQERAWINEQHLKLCRIPAQTFFEGARAEWMVERFRAAGWEGRIDRAGNVIASLPGRKSDPAVAVTAHLDTVLAPRGEDDISVSPDGRFLGPGVSDNGAGLAALLALAGAWSAAPPFSNETMTPVLIANVGEEGEGNLSGMRYLCRAANTARPRAFLVLDGPDTEHITCRALASRRFEVIVSGPGGHSWSDHGAGNPVHAISRAITAFNDSVPGEGDARASYNFGLVCGGSSINSIPSEARAKVDLRSEDPSQIERMTGLLESAVSAAIEIENARATRGRVSAKVKEIGSRPGGALTENASILEAIRAVDAFLGIRSSLDCSSTDANIPLSMGLPAISIGAGGQGGGAHTLAEWFHPEGREVGLRRILLTLCLLITDKEMR
jgi:acetylornithine deacetylase/succinyl-diaminopimelate desuccinylase-like protein